MVSESGSFVQDISPCMDLWRSIDIRAQAVRDPDLGWRCEVFRAVLVPDERWLPSPWKQPPPVRDLLVINEVWPIGRLPALLTALESGELTLGGELFMVKRHAGNRQYTPVSSFYVRKYDRAGASQRYGLDWKTIVLNGWESLSGTREIQRAREKIDAQLQGSNPPWDGIADIRRTLFGMSEDEAQRFDFMSFEVVAPLLLRFGQTVSLEEDSLTLEIDGASTMNLRDVGVSVFFLLENQMVLRRHIDLRDESVDDTGDKSRVRIEVPATCSGAKCVLTYHEIAMDERRIFRAGSITGRSQWAAFHAFVGRPENLLEALDSTEGGDPFEHAVSALLHLLGFATGHYGRNAFGSDMADIFAVYPGAEWCLVVECTARELDLAAKIAKLVTRCKELNRTMLGCEIHPVLVTRQPRADISDTARGDAAKERVVLVTGDDLSGLVQLATQTPPPDKVRNHLLRLIPMQSHM